MYSDIKDAWVFDLDSQGLNVAKFEVLQICNMSLICQNALDENTWLCTLNC